MSTLLDPVFRPLTSSLAVTSENIPLELQPIAISSGLSPSNLFASLPSENSSLSLSEAEPLLKSAEAVSIEAANFDFALLAEDTNWLGTPRISQLDSLGEVLVVPGTSAETVSIVVQWTFRDAKYNNEVGVFVVDQSGKVGGFAPGEQGFAQAALQSSTRQTLFNSGNQAGNWRELTFTGGSTLAFYLIQNDTSANWLANNPSNTVGQQSLAFFSLLGANPDGFDHSRSTHLGQGIWRFNWEDLTGGGDQDFNDVVFNIGQSGILLPGEEKQQVPLTIDFVSEEATHDNEMGYFLVDDPNGRIENLRPGDVGYRDAALARHQIVFGGGEIFSSRTINLPSAKYLGWYLVSDGTTAQAMKNGEIPVFFSYSAANTDGLSHLHAQADSHTWAWEDIWSGGDRDFNDLVFRFNLGEPIGLPATLPSLSIGNVTLTEGDQDTQDANFTVRLSEASTQTVTAQFTTEDDTAKAGEDYESQSGIISFASGELEKTISIKVSGDRLQELTENFKVKLINASNALIGQGTGIGTILDEDSLQTNLPPTLSLENSVVAIVENTETSNRRQVADIVITDDALGNNQILLSGNDADSFEVEDSKLYLKAGTVLDFETKAEYSVMVTVDDPEVGSTPDDAVVYTLAITSSDPGLVSVSADLANDTGISNTDRLTYDPTVTGQTSQATQLWVSLNGNEFVDLSSVLQGDGSFTIGFDEYAVLANALLADGDYTLRLQARNEAGYGSEEAVVTFTLDLTPPAIEFALAPESDTGTLGDNVTTAYQVNLVGQTDSELDVMLLET
ncbi:MAG: DUF4114 domain-containing protein, partial [Snowella sp.]|nr:DUF4114 domain-containing protein [Snowella sp.]